jgi:poly-gamma-glutamate synthesis protein (capsule biosynthesis protein)
MTTRYSKIKFHALLIPLLISVVFLLTSCQFTPPSLISNKTQTPSFVAPTNNPTTTPLATPVVYRSPFLSWAEQAFPKGIKDQLNNNSLLEFTDDQSKAQVVFTIDNGNLIGSWIYVAVVPFHSFQDDISVSELQSIWKGQNSENADHNHIHLSRETKEALTLIWGDPEVKNITILNEGSLTREHWLSFDTLAIIPFEDIEISWKVLTIDGLDLFSTGLDISTYPLRLPLYINTVDIPVSSIEFPTFITNFNESKLTSIALTGVTALVRDTAAIMENEGFTYPASEIYQVLNQANITHISNEVPFVPDCPNPDPNQPSLYFCSQDSYLELLEYIGTDIVELSGDHFGDWGPEAMLHTLELYHQQGWLTYGGGETLQDGLEPVFIEHNGNSFAFLGCNGKAHAKYATASEDYPGASRCDFEWMISEIKLLQESGYIVIVTLQHEEVDMFSPVAIQIYDFGRLAEAGAVIVSGSQAHHPQAFNFTGKSFIHYGLGNLFFDQWYLAKYNPSYHKNKDKSFIDLHYFYDGVHINTRFVTLKFVDNAKTRFMGPQEKESFLGEVFSHSIWEGESLSAITQ